MDKQYVNAPGSEERDGGIARGEEVEEDVAAQRKHHSQEEENRLIRQEAREKERKKGGLQDEEKKTAEASGQAEKRKNLMRQQHVRHGMDSQVKQQEPMRQEELEQAEQAKKRARQKGTAQKTAGRKFQRQGSVEAAGNGQEQVMPEGNEGAQTTESQGTGREQLGKQATEAQGGQETTENVKEESGSEAEDDKKCAALSPCLKDSDCGDGRSHFLFSFFYRLTVRRFDRDVFKECATAVKLASVWVVRPFGDVRMIKTAVGSWAPVIRRKEPVIANKVGFR